MMKSKTLLMVLMSGACLSAAALRADADDDVAKLDKATSTERNEAIRRLAEMGKDAFDALEKGMKNDYESVRADCARLLGLAGDERAVDVLMRHFAPPESGEAKGESSEKVRVAAAQALARLGKAIKREAVGSALLARFKAESLSGAERYGLASALAELGYAPAFEDMKALLKPEGDPALGACTVSYLETLGDNRSSDALLAFLREKKTEGEGDKMTETWAFPKEAWKNVRARAVIALARKRHPEAGVFLVEEISEPAHHQQAVMDEFARLARSYGKDLVPALTGLLSDTKKRSAHTQALAMLAEIGSAGLEGLIGLMEDGLRKEREAKADGRTEANSFAGSFRQGVKKFSATPEGRSALVEAYRKRPAPRVDEEDKVREQIFDELIEKKSSEARDIILEGLESSDTDTVVKAVSAWVKVSAGRDLEPLREAAQHPDHEVRVKLAEELGSTIVPTFRAQPLLIDLSKDDDEDVRIAAWKGLARVDDIALLPEFTRGVGDDDPNVQEEAARALGKALSGLKLDDAKHKAERATIAELMTSALTARNGAARGFIDQYSNFNTRVLKDDPERGDEIKRLASELVDAEDAGLRAQCARQWSVLSTGNAWLKRLADAFAKENDPSAAVAQMEALATKLSFPNSDDFRAIISDPAAAASAGVKWLDMEEIRGLEPKKRAGLNPASSAARFLGTLGKSAFAPTLSAVKAAVRASMDAAERDKHEEKDATVTAYGIQALISMEARGQSDLIFDAVAKVSHWRVTNHASQYLQKFGTTADIPRAQSMAFFSAHDKENIEKRIRERKK